MPHYMRKPCIVHAEPFYPKVHPWPEGVVAWADTKPRDTSWGYVETPEGRRHVMFGSWIITDEQGRHSTCDDATFRATYDPVPSVPATALEYEPVVFAPVTFTSEQVKNIRLLARDEIAREIVRIEQKLKYGGRR